jgi:hypothetical protein
LWVSTHYLLIILSIIYQNIKIEWQNFL